MVLILKQILLNLRKEKYVEQWKVPRAVDDVQEVLSWFDLELASVSHQFTLNLVVHNTKTQLK